MGWEGVATFPLGFCGVLLDSLSDIQDDVNIMGYGVAGGDQCRLLGN